MLCSLLSRDLAKNKCKMQLKDAMYICVHVYCRNELSWRYQMLLQSLERKKTEVEQLSQEFESKIRTKEVLTVSNYYRIL